MNSSADGYNSDRSRGSQRRGGRLMRYLLWGSVSLLVVVTLITIGLMGLSYFGSEQVRADTAPAQPGASNRVAAGTTMQTDSTTVMRPLLSVSNELVIVDGVVVPQQHAALSMATSGIVAELLVQEGSTVAAGAVILRLRNAQEAAAVAQAQAGLLRTQAYLEELQEGTRAEEISAAQANVDAAQARLAKLAEGARSEEITAAQSALQAAVEEQKALYQGPKESDRIAAEAELANAAAKLAQAQAAYDRVAGASDIAMRPESLQLQEATNSYNAAQARYDALFVEPNADAVASAQAKVQRAQADLDKLLAPASRNAIAEAKAELNRAQADLELSTAGTRRHTLQAAQADVDEAKAILLKARADLADTELHAPFAGTLAAVDVRIGEQVSAGAAIVQLADLTQWQVETENLNEIDVVHVKEGDRVQLTFDAITNLDLTGRVLRIKPYGENRQGDITYTAIIQLEQQTNRLLWNMTAVARIE